MLLWLNGPFGVGKTVASARLLECVPGSRLFDPEVVGYMLRRFITEPVDDFQHWDAWRALVAETAVEIHRHDGSLLVAPMSLLDRAYAAEIFERVSARGIPQAHVVLHADRDELVRRTRRPSSTPRT